ncbi:MAG: aminoglycoside 6-adenylyltransferase [Anaerolineae bacterium]|nr:aminoglycoside 6-adenylyltransferase [Anaerolineae bacterium]
MTETGLWQKKVVQDLDRLLCRDPDVLALAVFGSLVQPQVGYDVWSDVDVLLVVEDRVTHRFHPPTEWLEALGAVYAIEQSCNAFWNTTRVCFEDLRRIDLLITSDSNLRKIDEWPRHPFRQGIEVVFSRASWINDVLANAFPQPELSLPSAEQYQAMVERFWFKSVMAVYKVARDDLLVALHLALDLVRDCCVLGMMLRDRTEGTAHHREGGIGNRVVAQLRDTEQPYTAAGILTIVEQSSVAFDELASQWSEDYRENRQPLLKWVGQAREVVTGEWLAGQPGG